MTFSSSYLLGINTASKRKEKTEKIIIPSTNELKAYWGILVSFRTELLPEIPVEFIFFVSGFVCFLDVIFRGVDFVDGEDESWVIEEVPLTRVSPLQQTVY